MANKKYEEMRNNAICDIIECLENGFSDYYCDLHNEVFNTDYYIIGTHNAKEELTEFDVFNAIEKVQEYERFNFGELYTDISDPEKLVNMLYYIIGEEVISELYDIPAFNDNYDNAADEEINKAIVSEMKKRYKVCDLESE